MSVERELCFELPVILFLINLPFIFESVFSFILLFPIQATVGPFIVGVWFAFRDFFFFSFLPGPWHVEVLGPGNKLVPQHWEHWTLTQWGTKEVLSSRICRKKRREVPLPASCQVKWEVPIGSLMAFMGFSGFLYAPQVPPLENAQGRPAFPTPRLLAPLLCLHPHTLTRTPTRSTPPGYLSLQYR